MGVFRWLIGVVFGLLAAGSALAFVVFITSGIDLWIERARAWRRLAFAAAMFWFNVEIWRRVVLIVVNW